MKEKIHPIYQEVLVTCACGNQFRTRSTKKDLRLDICSVCHPFYTGKQKLLDTAGRVERFKKRFEKGQAKVETLAAAKEAAKAAPAPEPAAEEKAKSKAKPRAKAKPKAEPKEPKEN